LIDWIQDILGLRKRDWTEVKRLLTDDQVRQIYQVVSYLWPRDTNLPALLPTPSAKLRGLFLGTQRPENILANVLRYSLYSDEIVIISPFVNPNCIIEKYNPLAHPELYKSDLLKIVLMLLQLAPWIKDGIVVLIPNPGDSDYSLQKTAWSSARARWRRNHYEGYAEYSKEMESFFKQDFERALARTPQSYLEHSIRRFDPQFDDETVANMITLIRERARGDPLALEQPLAGDINMITTGTNLEMGLYIAQAIGAYLFTNLRVRWNEILSVSNDSSDEASVWSPLTQAFQQLNFKFLDGVSMAFARNMRERGRLEQLRSVLRRIWAEIGGNPDPNQSQRLARDFGDELKQRVAESEADWEKIDQALLKWAGTTAVTSLAALPTIQPGNLSVNMAGTSIALITELLITRVKRRRFYKSVPLSVLLELKRKAS